MTDSTTQPSTGTVTRLVPRSDVSDAVLSAKATAELSWCDGFLTAIIIGPEHIPEREWIDYVLPLEDKEGHSALEREMTSVFLRTLHAGMKRVLQDTPEQFIPLFPNDGSERIALASEWAQGFHEGTGLREALWQPVMDDPDKMELIVPIIGLVTDENGQYYADLEAGVEFFQVPREQVLDRLADLIPQAVLDTQQFWSAQRQRSKPAAASNFPTGKIGRNDPCPCGSGLKYKKCCLN